MRCYIYLTKHSLSNSGIYVPSDKMQQYKGMNY